MDLDTKETRETHNLYTESIHGSFKNIIKYLYGESILAKVNIFSKFRSSQETIKLAFLQRCRDNNIIPKFLQFKDLGTHKSKNILHKTSLILIKEHIHFTKLQITQISHKTFKLHLFLPTLRYDIWQILDHITYEQVMKTHTQSSERQK